MIKETELATLLIAARALRGARADALSTLRSARDRALRLGDTETAEVAAFVSAMGEVAVAEDADSSSPQGAGEGAADEPESSLDWHHGICTFCGNTTQVAAYRDDARCCASCAGQWAELVRFDPNILSAVYGLTRVPVSDVWFMMIEAEHQCQSFVMLAIESLKHGWEAPAVDCAARAVLSIPEGSAPPVVALKLLDLNGHCDTGRLAIALGQHAQR